MDRSPDSALAGGHKISSRSSASSSSIRKDFLRKFIDSEILTVGLEDWFVEQSSSRKPNFDAPFELTELQSLDYALEGVPFQQLVRMPNALLRTSTSDAVEATAHLALEDFLHAALKGLWETFWGHDSVIPFYVSSIHSSSSKFYTAEKAIASGKLEGLCATAIMLKNGNLHAKWDQIVQLTLLRPDITTLSIPAEKELHHFVLGEALFFAVRVLVSRSLSRSATSLRNSNWIFVLLVDSQYCGVVKVEGDINKLDFHSYNVYESTAEWIKMHVKLSVSAIDRVWNKLGNPNWGDIGTLHILLTTFHSMVRFSGIPKYSPQELAIEHGSRLRTRRAERHLVHGETNGNEIICFQEQNLSPEIVEVERESIRTVFKGIVNLEKGSVVCLEESNWQKAYRIIGKLIDSEASIYCASLVDELSKMLILYVGSSPLYMEVNLWYQVQRQTKILTLMSRRGLSNKHLPQVAASGKIIHPGQCHKPSTRENCGHPWCGTPILVTYPYGETVSYMVRNGLFGPEEALGCCHDCLSAIAAASSAGIRHGDISPENVICAISGVNRPFFVLIGWGHAVLEEKDRPAMNLRFSSTNALQEGKLCAASDAESLIYLLYFSCGGGFPDLDSVEGALQWRETVWSRRGIQQKLGEISAVLKAFADYVDSLCGTPYPIDYEIWLRRLRRPAADDEDHSLRAADFSN